MQQLPDFPALLLFFMLILLRAFLFPSLLPLDALPFFRLLGLDSCRDLALLVFILLTFFRVGELLLSQQ
jgi:hypothetical protein